MAVDFKLIGTRIKSVRKEKGRTQEWLAEKIDVTVGYISQIERGITKINLETLGEIGAVLETDIAYFLSGVSTEQELYLKNELHQKFEMLSERDKKIVNEIIETMINVKKKIGIFVMKEPIVFLVFKALHRGGDSAAAVDKLCRGVGRKRHYGTASEKSAEA